MSDGAALIAAWARTAVAPHGGAFRTLHPHDMAAPVLRSLLQRAAVPPEAVDALIIGNALGAGGNPARMLALAAGLPDRCAALSVDTQCCSGLDAISMAVGMLVSGQARVVIAGGVEAWSRSPIRQHRPMHPGEVAATYERPAFSPDPARDPDLLESAADFAEKQGFTRRQQDDYAIQSHHRAVTHRPRLAEEIVIVNGLDHDAYPREMSPERAARIPVAVQRSPASACAVSSLSISSKADGAALVLLATPDACRDLGMAPRAAWIGSCSMGSDPSRPLLAAQAAAQAAMLRAGIGAGGNLRAIELHDAFAVQGLSFCQELGLAPSQINRRGGGLARGHPIGASGAVALVRLLSDLDHDEISGAMGLAAIAGAGGIGAAVIVERL
ncbi:thiolase family protein [Rhodoferax sp.]|uniref:thiolase family protein n=1 Tax=Rhodoferax sp. TaxID=50421 RepID=UPI00283E78D1|nr:thiolase family protein [Rhodoferax sp.]MDR3371525.1 thiolase family protein [Rhodoferax sp.]